MGALYFTQDEFCLIQELYGIDSTTLTRVEFVNDLSHILGIEAGPLFEFVSEVREIIHNRDNISTVLTSEAVKLVGMLKQNDKEVVRYHKDIVYAREQIADLENEYKTIQTRLADLYAAISMHRELEKLKR